MFFRILELEQVASVQKVAGISSQKDVVKISAISVDTSRKINSLCEIFEIIQKNLILEKWVKYCVFSMLYALPKSYI